MNDNTLLSAILSRLQNNLRNSIIVLVVGLIIGGYFFAPYLDALKNPINSSNYTELLEYANENPGNRLFTVPADYESEYVFDTAFMEDEKVLDYYVALLDEDGNFILAEVPAQIYEDDTITNYIGHFISPKEGLISNINEDLINEGLTQDEVDAIMPTKVFRVENNRSMIMIFAIILGVILLLVLRNIMIFIKRNNDPSSSRLGEALKPFGTYEDLAKEFELVTFNKDLPNIGFTANYIVLIHSFSVSILPKDNLMWSHAHITRHKAYYVITVSKSYKLVLFTTKGRFEVQMSEQQVNKALEIISSQMPWVILGYGDEIQKAWSKNQSEVVAHVNARKAAILNGDVQTDSL